MPEPLERVGAWPVAKRLTVLSAVRGASAGTIVEKPGPSVVLPAEALSSECVS